MCGNGCGGLNLGGMCIGWGGGEEWVGAEKGERGLLFFPFLPASVCWPLLTHDTDSHSSLQPNSLLSSQSIQHREDNAAASEPRAASGISSPGQHLASLQSLLLRNIEVRTPCPLCVCGHQNSCPKLAGAEKLCRRGCVRDFCEMLSLGRFILATELPFCYMLCLPGESLQGGHKETEVGQDGLCQSLISLRALGVSVSPGQTAPVPAEGKSSINR